MVQGTLHLDDGETVIIVADDMLSALKLANEKYYGKTRKMDFKTVEVDAEDGGCEVGEDHNGHVRQQEDKAPATAS